VRADRRRIVPLPGDSSDLASESTESLADCPECGVPATVLAAMCLVCFAELDEVAPFGLASAS
jgi:hypothetical protein